jgi:Baseplate J-like protein
MQLNLRTFDTIVASGAAAVQAAATTVLDLTVGSVLRAVLEANAGLGLWLQWLLLQVLQTTRAATSTGSDLDSWMADFGLTRLAAQAASGNVTFARFSPVINALVPVGTMVRTSDGSQNFDVTVDATNAAWNAAQNGYTLAAGVASVTVPVVAVVAGSAGNVQAGAITLIAAAVPGVDTVSNAGPTANGLDAETDTALRTRFAAYLISLFKATTAAVGYAISTVQQGLQYTVQENVTQSGTAQQGCFVVTVDDGSGYPPAALLLQVASAIEAVRPVGSVFAVTSPNVSIANVNMSISTQAAASHAGVVSVVAAAITSFIDGLAVGATLPWSRLAQVAYDASASVTNVTAVALNGTVTDLSPGPGGVVKAGSVVVS